MPKPRMIAAYFDDTVQVVRLEMMDYLEGDVTLEGEPVHVRHDQPPVNLVDQQISNDTQRAAMTLIASARRDAAAASSQ